MINAVKFGRGLKTFSCCSEDGSIAVFDVNGNPLRMFEAVPYGELNCITSDGTFAVTGGSDGAIRIWRLDKSTKQSEIFTIEAAHDVSIECIDVSRDGKLIVSGCANISDKMQ